MRAHSVIAASLSALFAAAHAHATPPRGRAHTVLHSSSPSPIALSVQPNPDSLWWTFTLENTSSNAVTLIADRHLLTLEPEATEVPTPRSHRARPTTTVHRCVAPVRPMSNERARQRVQLEPGARYTEGFDVRELCGLNLASRLTPGMRVVAHYGFGGNATSFAHAVVLDGQDPPVVDVATVAWTVPGTPGNWPPQAEHANEGDPRMAVAVTNTPDAANISSASISVRVTSSGLYPVWLFSRPGQVRFVFTTPDGRRVACRRSFREYNAVREFFVRLTRGRSISEEAAMGSVCSPDEFPQPGIYRGQAIFETHASGERLGMQSFVGLSSSPYFYLRLTRGQPAARYVRQTEADPFAPPRPAADDAASPAP